jgi:S-adenosylmethionine:tRNA ribosyltransferase-isomerase
VSERTITRSDLSYVLPPELIAQHPMRPRDASRLLLVERDAAGLGEIAFSDLADRLGPHDLLVVNDTRVLTSRLRGRKASGGQVDALLLEREPDGCWQALVKCSGRLRRGLKFEFDGARAQVVELHADGRCSLRFERHDAAVSSVAGDVEWLGKVGELPLPPYIDRDAPRADDATDYQTVFADKPGAVAAPTASLHFSRALAARLPMATLTLHVGAGTFRPIRGEDLADHVIDAERYEVPEATARVIANARALGGRVIAVGTTVVRALETTGGAAGSGRSGLFIRPGYRFRVVDELITNFHLPGSSLIALVMAFAGVERTRAAYRHAIEERFRFYSYGDAMWVR